MKGVLSGGERERGEKEINSTTLRKCSEKDTNEILPDNRSGHLFIDSTTKGVELEGGGNWTMNNEHWSYFNNKFIALTKIDEWD